MFLSSTALAQEDAIAMQLKTMTLREKVGQLFCIRPDALDGTFSNADLNDHSAAGVTALSQRMRDTYRDYPCGGFALFQKNLESPDRLTQFTQDLHAVGRIPSFIAIDEEGGRVARLGNHPGFHVPTFSPMGTLARGGNPKSAYIAGASIGKYLASFGIDLDFAPVADVNTNPANPVIGDRAFGDNPAIASDFVVQFLKGLHARGVAGCLKHFPGHGDTSTDTHTGYAETGKTWEEMRSCEMLPFLAGIENGADMIMTAHIAAPSVTGSEEPSTVSYTMLTEKLRGELGYDGLIITDALCMGAITRAYDSAQACILCLQAGCDILLMPYDYRTAFDGVVDAVEKGILSEDRIDESVRRVLAFKEARREVQP